jgi:hypothetical protein
LTFIVTFQGAARRIGQSAALQNISLYKRKDFGRNVNTPLFLNKTPIHSVIQIALSNELIVASRMRRLIVDAIGQRAKKKWDGPAVQNNNQVIFSRCGRTQSDQAV